MSDHNWWLLRKLIQDELDRYANLPALAGIADGLRGALAYMSGIEGYEAADTEEGGQQ